MLRRDSTDLKAVSMGWWWPKYVYYVVLWYTFSVGLSLYNKFLIGSKHGGFPAPLLMTAIHFFMQCVIANFILKIRPAWAPYKLSWWDYGEKVVPPAVFTALDIGLSNLSLAFITLTFYTMCKSSAPVFLLIFAFTFNLETPSFRLLGVILTISVGVLLTVAGEGEFELVGFLLVMSASIMSGARWVLIQMLLQKERLGLTNPIATLACLTPIMTTVMASLSFFWEAWGRLGESPYFDSPPSCAHSAAIMGLGGCIAFLMILCEFLLISETSALTFAVIGTMKEAVTIFVSQAIFHDALSVVNGVGFVVILIGVLLFNLYRGMAKEHRKTAPLNLERESGDGEAELEVEIGELEMLVGKDKYLPDSVDRISTDSPKTGRGTIGLDVLNLVPSPRPIKVVDGANVVAQQGSPYRSPTSMGSPGASGLHERRIDERGVPTALSC